MELPKRPNTETFLPDGTFTQALADLRECPGIGSLRIVIAYAFDPRTHMLPYWYCDRRMAPCSVRTLADMLDAAGFKHVRVVLQQWNPNFQPSKAILDGKPIDILMVSAMQVHGEPACDLVREAHNLGENRPLVLAGGPKAIYEPTDFLELGDKPGIGADCVMTGEAYVLLDFLKTLAAHGLDQANPQPGSARAAFNRARDCGDIDKVPGLVYMDPKSTPQEPRAVNTGVQQLLQNLDEIPMPDAGYRLLEKPHRRATLDAKPCPADKVGKISLISSVISTHGCKFNCGYCPIPAVNQRTWRHKSPKRLAEEIKSIHENFGIEEFFSTDDNFFNSRETVVELMTAMAETKLSNGTPLGQRIRFYTEGTEFDVFKNMDILPLCKKAGMSAIWFGIEDLSAELINKGQTGQKTEEVFAKLNELGIEPMAMMMHSDDQPLHAPKGDMRGLLNQARFLFDNGAVSYQCTNLSPAVGTRSIDEMVEQGLLYDTVGGERVPQAFLDGNHVVASKTKAPWSHQMHVLRAYATFYNPVNTVRVILNWRKSTMSPKKLLFQIIGQIGLVLTAPKLWLWSRKLKRGPIQVWEGLITARIPMVDAQTRCETQWAIKHKPSSYLPQPGSDSEEKKRTTPAPAIPASPSAKKMGKQGLPLSVLPSQ